MTYNGFIHTQTDKQSAKAADERPWRGRRGLPVPMQVKRYSQYRLQTQHNRHVLAKRFTARLQTSQLLLQYSFSLHGA